MPFRVVKLKCILKGLPILLFVRFRHLPDACLVTLPIMTLLTVSRKPTLEFPVRQRPDSNTGACHGAAGGGLLIAQV